jgi:hypothetical protein
LNPRFVLSCVAEEHKEKKKMSRFKAAKEKIKETFRRGKSHEKKEEGTKPIEA